MRNMSFMLTKEQARAKTKTVTRRIGWSNLRPGDRVQQVEKGQGLKKGEKIVKLHVIECVSNRREPLCMMLDAANIYGISECTKEGFPTMAAGDFIKMFCEHNDCEPHTIVNRIEFKYV